MKNNGRGEKKQDEYMVEQKVLVVLKVVQEVKHSVYEEVGGRR